MDNQVQEIDNVFIEILYENKFLGVILNPEVEISYNCKQRSQEVLLPRENNALCVSQSTVFIVHPY